MLFLFLKIFVLVTWTAVLSNTLSLSRRGNLTTIVDACDKGTRNVVQNGEMLLQTLEWQIGSLSTMEMPQSCRTTMSMEYSDRWQYAVIAVQWMGAVKLQALVQATVQLRYDQEAVPASGVSVLVPGLLLNLCPEVSKAKSIQSILTSVMSGPRNERWQENIPIDTPNQRWSPCGQVKPFTFEWSVDVKGRKLQRTATDGFGTSTTVNEALSLHIVTQWRPCQ
jgi:hypothetical protein